MGTFYTITALKAATPNDTLLGWWVVQDVAAALELIGDLKNPPDGTTKFEIAGPFSMKEDLLGSDKVRTVIHIDDPEAP